MTENFYFRLTEAFNARGKIAILASGQAVVYYRLAIMSKDGNWILRETPEACETVLEVLAKHGARYRPGAPLDPRWLAGGWSSHFELRDSQGRRIRCDFFSRPPRVPEHFLEALFEPRASASPLAVVDIVSLIRMKETQRAKDYAVIGELARLLPSEQEIEMTTDVDRLLDLAPRTTAGSERSSVRIARRGGSRLEVVQALAVEIDEKQRTDRLRLEAYGRASRRYLEAFRRLDRDALVLPGSHSKVCELAESLLPENVSDEGDFGNEDAQ